MSEDVEFRDQFLVRFDDDRRSIDEYREKIGHLFETHADPVVFEAFDAARF